VFIVAITVVCAAAAFLACEKFMSRSGPEDSSKSAPAPVADLPALKAKAEQGDPQAQDQLGRLYARGQAVPLDYAQAAKWYRLAATQGNADAQADLGELCQAGQGVPKSIPEALKWFQLAAAQGNAGAAYNLGFLYEQGQDVRKDQAQAAKWYLAAAEYGDALAQYDIGQRFNLGVGVKKDLVEGFKWLSLAAAQGQSDAAMRRDKARGQMTSEEIAEANRRITSFVPKKGPVAAK